MLSGRLAQLYAGLVLYGASLALMIRADLGLDPRDVFHQGLAQRLGWSFGTVVIGSVGVGTVVYAVTIGPLVHRLLPLLEASGRPVRRSTGA